MSKHDNDTCPHLVRASLLEGENARLKAEVERLTEDNRQLTKAFEIAEGIIKRMGKAAEAAAKEGKPSV